jgi:hypothetical protein
MLPLLVAMQVGQPDPGAAAQPPPPPPAQQQQSPQQVPPGYTQQYPPGYAPQYPQQYPQGYPQQYPYAYGYPYAQPEKQRPPKKPEPDRPVSWFVRAAIGVGPPGFSEQTSLLRLEGYGGAKFWATADGGWMFHENAGVGAWGALSLWSSSPGLSPELSENAYFLGGEIPLKLGSRDFSLVLAPRVGWGTGQLELLGDASFQHAFAFGADLGLTSFKYHLGGHIGILRAAVSPPGRIGRDHDYGGLYFLVGGSIDG